MQCCHQSHEGWAATGKDVQWLENMVHHSYNPGRAVCLGWEVSFYELPKLYGMMGGKAGEYSRYFFDNKELFQNMRGALRPSRLVHRLVRIAGPHVVISQNTNTGEARAQACRATLRQDRNVRVYVGARARRKGLDKLVQERPRLV